MSTITTPAPAVALSELIEAGAVPGDCPFLCWAFRHFDYCMHTDPVTDPDILAVADEERRWDR